MKSRLIFTSGRTFVAVVTLTRDVLETEESLVLVMAVVGSHVDEVSGVEKLMNNRRVTGVLGNSKFWRDRGIFCSLPQNLYTLLFGVES